MATTSSADLLAPFQRIDPDALCLSCLQIGDQSAGCTACGFDERDAMTSPLHLPPRTILHGQYLLGRVLGQGGFGITYLAWDLNLEMPVALKEFLPTDFASRASGQLSVTPYGEDGPVNFELGLDAFEAEARTLARCYGLSGVVDVLTYFRENGTGYIVMHYLQGRTFRDYLRARSSPLSFADAMTVVRPVLAALQEVHRLGLVHRDISPDNIYICDSGRVCLLDFGAARNAVRDRSKSLSVQFKVGYTPEEQYRRHGAQGPWTDVYAAAATFYRAITGVTPPSSLDRLKQDQLRPPGALGATLSRRSERALMRALATHADDRYRTVAEFLSELEDPSAASGAPAAASDAARTPVASHGLARWIVAATIDLGRVIRAWIDAALTRATSSSSSGSGRHERAIREQLAALWPVTLVSASLRDPHLPAGPDHGPLDVYARDDTARVGFAVVLQNNYAGIKPLRGSLRVAVIDPRGAGRASAGDPTAGELQLPVEDFVDRVALEGAWEPQDGFTPGVWRTEFWWDGRKIGEHEFIISV